MSAPAEGASPLQSLRDVGLVAGFHLLRAIRTRSLLLLCMLFTIAMTGASWIFTRILLSMENTAARGLAVPTVDKPGAMLDTLREKDQLRELLAEMVGDPALMDLALSLPVLTVAHFWMALALVPLLGAATGAEIISEDLRTRAVRFELVRTGRLELVSGRFLGQALMLGLAALVAVLGTWTIAMTAMVKQPAWDQFATLVAYTPRIWVFSIAFLGIGTACSQLTASTNIARSLALGLVVVTWTAFGWFKTETAREWLGPVIDVLQPILPQTWAVDLWRSGFAWLDSGAALLGLGFVFLLVGYVAFAKRDV